MPSRLGSGGLAEKNCCCPILPGAASSSERLAGSGGVGGVGGSAVGAVRTQSAPPFGDPVPDEPEEDAERFELRPLLEERPEPFAMRDVSFRLMWPIVNPEAADRTATLKTRPLSCFLTLSMLSRNNM